MRLTIGSAIGVLAMLGWALPAAAADSTVQADLKPVAGNGVQGSGKAMVQITGNTLTVTMAATGLLPDNPHAAHIHFGAEARHECPNLGDDTDKDGHLTTTEGGPAYGPVVVSLTKTGDTSAKSVLAIDRYDTAPGGDLQYERGSIQVSDEVAAAIAAGKSVVVIHGVDYDHDGAYGGSKKSELDPSLPTEATDPALCGVLTASQMSGMPAGGVQTGGGSTAGVEDPGLLIGGGAAVLFGAALFGGALIGRRKLAGRAS
ncbi:CHRD domain-containing protein [Nakamurella lactea]|uniref:CHRD domain-containing protein n=1 Tax=Nakamurella lactea TaxID=459515 RepID=UPI00056522DC|nr:CHRD domain-containing protein [Nakamurella lactea]